MVIILQTYYYPTYDKYVFWRGNACMLRKIKVGTTTMIFFYKISGISYSYLDVFLFTHKLSEGQKKFNLLKVDLGKRRILVQTLNGIITESIKL